MTTDAQETPHLGSCQPGSTPEFISVNLPHTEHNNIPAAFVSEKVADARIVSEGKDRPVLMGEALYVIVAAGTKDDTTGIGVKNDLCEAAAKHFLGFKRNGIELLNGPLLVAFDNVREYRTAYRILRR